jgi:molybdate/tungstate transport system substrate-binding protein
MRKTLSSLTALVMIIAMVIGMSACGRGGIPQERISLKVLNAGSLMVPFKQMAEEFESQHSNVDVLIEGHGSIQVIRHATEVAEISGELPADVVAVADYSLIPMLMYQRKIPESTENYADWCINFATNRLGIAYNPGSKYAGEIDSTNWYEVLSRPDVKVGISDPRFDACWIPSLNAMPACRTILR